MTRRTFLCGLTLGTLAAPLSGEAQQAAKVWRVGYLGNTSGPQEITEAFRQGLRELGYIEGQNILIEYRWAGGETDQAHKEAAELVGLKVDVILASSSLNALAAKQATGKDFGRLINTHHHGDHVNGNQFFTHAETLSHPYCRTECIKAAATTPKMWTATPGVADGTEERKLVPPSVTFKDDLTYFIGGTEVQFKFAGPAHTWGDMMAYLPKYKILFAGDIGFFWVAPYANNSWITKWLETCDKIAGWDVDVIVPGHGPIGRKKELAEMANYFRVLGVETRKRYDAKMTPGAAAAEIRLGRFDNWIGPERLIMDVVRWYEEWDDTLTPDFNTAAVREATIEYNQVKASGKHVGEIIPLPRMEALMAEIC